MSKHESGEHQGRRFDATIEIDAPIEDVWKAISEGEQISKWFALDANVEPGEGGSVWLSWGPKFEATEPIDIWQPNKRLRVRQEMQSDPNTPAVKMLVDYYLESAGGKTLLRLVHSGFGEEDSWDGEFDSISAGWKIFMRNLRHYVAHHFNKPGINTWELVPSRFDAQASWDALAGDEKPLRLPADAKEGAAFSLHAGATTLTGTLDLCYPGRVVGGRVAELNDGLVRFTVGQGFKAVELTMLAWDCDRARFDAAQADLLAMLREEIGERE